MNDNDNIFIINRDLLTTTKEMVEWFQSYGLNPTIIDNDSSYPDLLDWYAMKPCPIIQLGENIGGCNAIYCWKTFWQWKSGRLLVTDSDLDLSEIPNDWQEKLEDLLQEFPEHKIGFSLNIKGLPVSEITDSIVKWEEKFWLNAVPNRPNCYFADIDSTFYLANQRPFNYMGIRLGDYCCRHCPWEYDLLNLSPEYKYYLRNCSGVSTWGHRIKAFLEKNGQSL